MQVCEARARCHGSVIFKWKQIVMRLRHVKPTVVIVSESVIVEITIDAVAR